MFRQELAISVDILLSATTQDENTDKGRLTFFVVQRQEYALMN